MIKKIKGGLERFGIVNETLDKKGILLFWWVSAVGSNTNCGRVKYGPWSGQIRIVVGLNTALLF